MIGSKKIRQGQIEDFISAMTQTSLDSKQPTLSGSGFVISTAGVITYLTNNTTNWNTAYTDRNKWDGGSTGLVAATGRTSLGATTVGGNIFMSGNPSAIAFLRANADNSVSWLSASLFNASIGGIDSRRLVTDFDTITGTGILEANGQTTINQPVSSSWGAGIQFTTNGNSTYAAQLV